MYSLKISSNRYNENPKRIHFTFKMLPSFPTQFLNSVVFVTDSGTGCNATRGVPASPCRTQRPWTPGTSGARAAVGYTSWDTHRCFRSSGPAIRQQRQEAPPPPPQQQQKTTLKHTHTHTHTHQRAAFKHNPRFRVITAERSAFLDRSFEMVSSFNSCLTLAHFYFYQIIIHFMRERLGAWGGGGGERVTEKREKTYVSCSEALDPDRFLSSLVTLFVLFKLLLNPLVKKL